MEPRGRGKARGGRARGGESSSNTRPGPQGQFRGPQAGAGGGVAPQGAWGNRPGGQQQQQQPRTQQPQPQTQRPPQGAWGNRQGGNNVQQPPQPQQSQQQQSQQPLPSEGRGGRTEPITQVPIDEQTGETKETTGQVSGGGDVGISARGERGGGVRGKLSNRARGETMKTRMAHVEQSKKGSSGQVVALTANYFQILNKPDWQLQQYRVEFNPTIDDTRIKKKLVNIGFKQVDDIGGYLFDGTCLFTPTLFKEDLTRTAQIEGQAPVVMHMRRVSDIKWGDYGYIQIFNILVRMCLRFMKLQLVGRNYFDPRANVSIPNHKLNLWPGYFTSMRQNENNIMLNVEQTCKVMRTDNCYDLMMECRGTRGLEEFRKKIIGSVVLTYYNNKTYRIDDVETSLTPMSKFQKKTGESISYMEYYAQRYNVRINVQQQPLLVSRSSPREIRAGLADTIFLIPELCQLTGLSDEQRANFQLMAALAEHTRIGPQKRQDKLHEFVKKLNNNPEIVAELKRWDMKVAQELVKFQGRVLPQENLRFGDNRNVPAGPKADWTMSFRSCSMFAASAMNKLAVITPDRDHQLTEEFMKYIAKAAKGMRWNTDNFKVFPIKDDRVNSYLEKIEELSQMNPTLILCVIPNKTADRYNAIKKKCLCDRAIPSQVVVARNLKSKGVMSIATKVAVQLNCKIGGAPWGCNIPAKGLMVVGYDVCRNSSNKTKSFGGMVASLDQACTRYFSSVSEHSLEEELSRNFGAFMLLACEKFRQVQQAYPSRICIFRDGVGDGQIPYVVEVEIKSIKAALAKIYGPEEANLKMSFIIVTKRINTRIFRGSENPNPGTVVDDVITLPQRYDFFIVSQCVNQGTVAPTNYNVVHDTMGLSPDQLQLLSYKLCHMYFNWSGTVRVPAPCQYAHKLAYLTAQNLNRPASPKLDTTLYYL